MTELINELKDAIINGKPKEEIEKAIGANINEVVRNREFYELGFEVVNEILDKCGLIDNVNIKNILELGYDEYGERVMLILPHIKCGSIGNELKYDIKEDLKEIESIFSSIEFIPIIGAVKIKIQEIILKYNSNLIKEGDKNGEVVKEEIRKKLDTGEEYDEDDGFDIDWEAEYNEIKLKYENMKKIIGIMKLLPIKFSNEDFECDFLNEEEEKEINTIIENRDLQRANEIMSCKPILIYGNKSRFGDSFMHVCAEKGWIEGIDLAIDYNILDDNYINKKGKNGKTPLMIAYLNHHIDLVKHLIEKGADIEAKNWKGETLLMTACQEGDLNIVKYLIEKGANIEVENSYKFTPLMFACNEGHLKVAKYLIEKGANIESKYDRGYTALMVSCKNRCLEFVKYLIENGASIDKKDDFGQTPLMIACQHGYFEIVKYLVGKGANIDEEDYRGLTSLAIAARNRHSEIEDYLKSQIKK